MLFMRGKTKREVECFYRIMFFAEVKCYYQLEDAQDCSESLVSFLYCRPILLIPKGN